MQAITDEQAKRNIAANVKRLRGDRSLNWLARQVGTCPIHITRLERASHLPTSGLLARLAGALGVTTDDLLRMPVEKKRKKQQSSA